MSTRCSIHFTYGDVVYANVYRHQDGHPTEDGVLGDLDKFFADVEAQCGRDTWFGDASYLAAKFVVWQAARYNRRLNARTREYEPAPPLAFMGVGVQVEDPGDITYRYRVDCHVDPTEGGRPTVTWQRALEQAWHRGPKSDEEVA